MSKITVWFIRCAMLYLVVALMLGLHMSMAGPGYPFIQVHTHFNLLGWMSMMIFGVAYHILPRFSGQPLWSEKLATAHLYLANIGLIGMALGWVLLAKGSSYAVHFIFSSIEFISVLFFVINMFKTVKAAPALRPPAAKK
ncbi:MAG: cbb3-type cytochrome c oxidase subunit I [Thermodesulfobacteriota bacterium]